MDGLDRREDVADLEAGGFGAETRPTCREVGPLRQQLPCQHYPDCLPRWLPGGAMTRLLPVCGACPCLRPPSEGAGLIGLTPSYREALVQVLPPECVELVPLGTTPQSRSGCMLQFGPHRGIPAGLLLVLAARRCQEPPFFRGDWSGEPGSEHHQAFVRALAEEVSRPLAELEAELALAELDGTMGVITEYERRRR